MSFGLSQQLQDQIVNVLTKLDDAGNKILGMSILDTQLPGIGKSINELFHDATANGPKVGDLLKLKDSLKDKK